MVTKREISMTINIPAVGVDMTKEAVNQFNEAPGQRLSRRPPQTLAGGTKDQFLWRHQDVGASQILSNGHLAGHKRSIYYYRQICLLLVYHI